jgi:hypothetical protein
MCDEMPFSMGKFNWKTVSLLYAMLMGWRESTLCISYFVLSSLNSEWDLFHAQINGNKVDSMRSRGRWRQKRFQNSLKIPNEGVDSIGDS